MILENLPKEIKLFTIATAKCNYIYSISHVSLKDPALFLMNHKISKYHWIAIKNYGLAEPIIFLKE